MKKVYRDGLGKYVNLIVTPRVIEKAKDHFGCETLDGVEIEDGGGAGTAGSHWKGRIFLEEAMVGVITTAALFYSSVTLALFEDRGYYTPDYSKAEDNYNFGYKKGCDFLMKTCKANTDSGVADEFCFTKDSATKQRCTYDRQGIGRCNVQSYDGLSQMYQYMSDPSLGGSMETLDYCPVVSAYDNAYCVMKGEGLFNFYGHEFAPTSRCFESTLMTNGFPNAGYGPRCIPTACSPEGRLYLRIQGQTASCPEDGSEGFADTSHLLSVEGKVKCPEASFICRGRESSGLSTIPTTATSPTVTHSALTFSVTTEEEGTCEERMEKCKKIAEFYPLCDYFTRMLQQCMSRKCSQEMAMLIRDTIGPEVRSRCRRNFQEQAGVCFDSWSGAKSLCGLVNGALGFSVRNSIMVSLTALLIALFL
ncbi:leishmanolysin [Angomonas deanei]|nr:leishmanolysin [Angomonas deanei]|eukprot:EPY25204.1 leishmanolysin [Angomonas deanei]